MRSSSGKHWIALDHMRALAAFLVFTWHFTHAETGYPIAFDGAPAIFPLALLDEGHTGVALFMTLSGYLFAKLLDGKAVNFLGFFWNRILRLVPLLLLVLAIVAMNRYRLDSQFSISNYVGLMLTGIAMPVLPNGGWSITVEAHFYLILPLLLAVSHYKPSAPLLFVAASILLRCWLYLHSGTVQGLAYWTIVGHVDQFLLGIFAFQQRKSTLGRHAFVGMALLSFALFYFLFDAAGGFYDLDGYPSRNPIWIVLPTIEGAAYALLIAYYDSNYSPKSKGLSWAVEKAGSYSYSIYLLHFFVVFAAARFIDSYVMDLSNFYIACLWSAVCFGMMIPVGYLSYTWIEEPFLNFRVRYLRELSPEDLGVKVRP